MRRKTRTKNEGHTWHLVPESIPAKLFIFSLRFVLFIYDMISLPIYFIIQRPDKRADSAQRSRSEQVDVNTWIRTDSRSFRDDDVDSTSRQLVYKYSGATLSEIFANAVKSFSDRQCLGYRALVTCPVMSRDEIGRHVMIEKSFRSDYTWYTYEQIGRRVHDIASGLYQLDLHPESRALFLASTSLEWFCASQACLQLGVQLVIAPEISDNSSLAIILDEAEVDVIFVSCDRIEKLSRLFESMKRSSESKTNVHIKQVVITDWQFSLDFGEPLFAKLQSSCENIVGKIISMGQVEEVGCEKPIELSCTKSLTVELPSLADPNLGFEVNLPTNETVDETIDSDMKRRRIMSASMQHIGFSSTSQGCQDSWERRQSARMQNCLRGSAELTKYSSASDISDLASSSPRLSLRDLMKSNRQTKIEVKPDDTAIIVYTHSSPGLIKASKLTHGYLARRNHYLFLDGMVNGEDIHCASVSLDNIIEFMTEIYIIGHGGSIGYSCGIENLFYDGKELLSNDRSDLEALSPTFLLLRPYILERLRASVQSYLTNYLNPILSFLLVYLLYDYKKFWALRHFKTPIINRLFCKKPKQLFGKNLKYVFCNGTADCSETKDFFTFMLDIPVIELYGPTEAVASLMSVDDIWDYKRNRGRKRLFTWKDVIWHNRTEKITDDLEEEKREDFFKDMQLLPPKVDRNICKENSSKNLLITSSVWCPASGVRIRLEQLQDFRTSDLPYPRGRLVIGGDVVCSGYFRRPQQEARSFYTDSNRITWFRTDDIVRVFPNGSFQIISSTSDIMRMSDGQFLSLSQVEHLLRNSQFVENVCAICGQERSLVIVLVVPNLRSLALKSLGDAKLDMGMGVKPEPEELRDIEFRREICNDRLLSEFVYEHLSQVLARAGLATVASRFLLVPEIWTPESELVTQSFEPRRNTIQKFYAAEIQDVLNMDFPGNQKRLSARVKSKRNLSRH